MPEHKELERARNYAFKLFKIRPRSEEELVFRLRQKKYSAGIIEGLIKAFKSVGYLDDLSFARAWVKERINKPLGLKRLIFELRQKGIDNEIIETVFKEVKEQYPERKIIIDLIKDKFKKLLAEKLDFKAKRKIQGYLLRRGFSPEVIMDVLEEL